MSSPTQRALEHCRKQGWVADIVERFNAHSFHKNDLFGFADLVVLGRGDRRPLALQVSSGDHHADRHAKILAEPRAELWLRDGGDIQVWTYRKAGARGKRKTYELRETQVLLTDFDTFTESYQQCLARVHAHLEAIRREKADRRAAKKAAKAAGRVPAGPLDLWPAGPIETWKADPPVTP
jgi:hypothetical protein